jgi:hypothetical protein
MHALPIDFVCSEVLNTAARIVKALKGDKFAEAFGLPFPRIIQIACGHPTLKDGVC